MKILNAIARLFRHRHRFVVVGLDGGRYGYVVQCRCGWTPYRGMSMDEADDTARWLNERERVK